MNTKIWNLFKESSMYRDLIEIFDPDATDFVVNAENAFRLNRQFGCDESIEDSMNSFIFFKQNFELQGYEFDKAAPKDDYISFIDSFEFRALLINENNEIELADDDEGIVIARDYYRGKNSYLEYMSLYFFFNNSFFKPILSLSGFCDLVRSCKLLGINIPQLPKHRDYRGAMIWYYDLCESFSVFQKKYSLSDSEFCACLYGLGEILHDESLDKEMPKPVNVWLTGASKDDYKSLEADMTQGGRWQCNINTRRGDIVVLYAVSPHSCIHSIWRADSEGSFNPFDYRQCRTRLVEGNKISPISLKELKDDPVFGTLPMLNNNLQGVGGKMLPSWAYSRLLSMIEAKGDDITILPKLFEMKEWYPGEIRRESDVEDKILVPFLHELGYNDADWTRQLRMKSGRKEEREIPDFVFFPYGEKHFENAPLLIEAKLHMASEKDRKDAFRQALSYARMMQSPIFAICDDEKIIIYEKQKDGSFYYEKPSIETHWASFYGDEETHGQIMKLISSNVIKNII